MERILAMKHDTYDKYLASDTNLPPRALLTAWDCLPSYRDDLVLVGGLAIRYLTKPPVSGQVGAVTLDVDFGISIGASNGVYPGIRDTLAGHGFIWGEGRFTRKFPGLNLHLDLLTDDGKADTGTAMVDDGLPVGVVPGIDRALECYRLVEVSGTTLLGVPLTQQIKVAEVGPMLALKLNAFGGPVGRKVPKDAHDILYLATNYVDGIDGAIAAFQREKATGNRAMGYALKCLNEHYLSPDAAGAVACAAFRLNNRHNEPENADESMQIRQQCATLATELLK